MSSLEELAHKANHGRALQMLIDKDDFLRIKAVVDAAIEFQGMNFSVAHSIPLSRAIARLTRNNMTTPSHPAREGA